MAPEPEPEPERRPVTPEPVAETEGCQGKTVNSTPQKLTMTTDDLAAEVLEEGEKGTSKTGIDTGSTTARNSEEKPTETGGNGPTQEAVYSVIPRASKRVIILLVAFGGLFSPLTSAIYLPALNSIADDLKVKTSYVNLSITTCTCNTALPPTARQNDGREETAI